jgi:hypothetical protein
MLLAMIFGLSVELSGYLGLLLLDGAWFGPHNLQRLRQQQIETARFLTWDAEDEARPAILTAPHPYVGFVYNPDFDPEGGRIEDSMPVSRWGLLDDKSPIRPRSDREFVIGIFGGSVAQQLSVRGIDALLGELRKAPELADRQLVVLRTALPGFKQPQQLMMLNYLLVRGGHLDAVINLDGANDVSLALGSHVSRGISAFYPRGWPRMLGAVGDPNVIRMIGEVTYLERLRGQIAGAFSYPWIRLSGAANFVWRLADNWLAGTLQQARVRLAEYVPKASELDRGFASHGPAPNYSDDRVLLDDLASVWRQSSLQMHVICAGLGIRYFHFLQPNQYVAESKPMSDLERSMTILPGSLFDRGIRRGYPRLRAAGEELSEAGVSFHDLTLLFQDVEEPLYVDTCCHLNQTGNDLLGAKVGAVLRDALALDASASKAPARGPTAGTSKPGAQRAEGERSSANWPGAQRAEGERSSPG